MPEVWVGAIGGMRVRLFGIFASISLQLKNQTFEMLAWRAKSNGMEMN